MTDLEIRSFKTSMIDHMNKFLLPIELKRLVLVDILDETTKLANSTLKEQVAALQQEKEKTDEAKMAVSDKSNTENSPG
ncbi:MAG: hypothetical protein J6Y02_08430 [Pseudobutyrivibrio sp.]|nr:hypothetical protein [Pseudobutyrivibrio sp.]